MEIHFEVVRIANVRNTVFASLRLCYVKHRNLLFNFTVDGFVDLWIIKFC